MFSISNLRLHDSEISSMISIVVALFCLVLAFLGGELNYRSDLVDVISGGNFVPFFVAGIAISIPLLLESAFDIYFQVIRREVMITRLIIISILFWASLFMFTTRHKYYHAEVVTYCSIILFQQTVCGFCSLILLKESTREAKKWAMIISSLQNVVTVLLIIVRYFIVPRSVRFILAGFMIVVFICCMLLYYHIYIWISNTWSELSTEQLHIISCIVIFTVCIITLALSSIYMVTTHNGHIYSGRVKLYTIQYCIVIGFTVCATIIPGRIAGHEAMLIKV
jgi:hypothetical protein